MVDNATAGIIVQHGFKIGPGASGVAGAEVNIYEDSATQDRPLASRAVHEQTGRSFRYSSMGAAVTAGWITGPDISAHSVVDTDNIVDGTGELAAGTKTILVDGTPFTATTVEQHGGGLFQITGDEGLGEQYLIKSNTVFKNTDEVTFTMYDGKVTLIATTTDFAIVGPPWRAVRGATLATDYICTGQAPRGFTNAYYGWMQTWGPAVCLADGAVTIGDQMYLSDAEEGTVQVAGGGGTLATDLDSPYIGDALYAGDDNGGVGVNIKLFG
jgi:hypothetical protein